MGDRSTIEWTDASWNPVTGCSKVSPGCAHCYAEELTQRFAGTWGVPGLPWTPANAAANVILRPERLDQPLRWTRPRRIFVNSMSDLFHEQVPDHYIVEVFARMCLATQHTFQVLTKRPERMRDLLKSYRFAFETAHRLMYLAAERSIPNAFILFDLINEEGMTAFDHIWLGTSIENRRFVHRADLLRETPAAVRFISAEPLLGPLVDRITHGRHCICSACAAQDWSDPRLAPCGMHGPSCPPRDAPYRSLNLTDIDWLIVGGESGPKHRPIKAQWVRDLRNACLEHADPGNLRPHPAGRPAFFFKQWGGRTPKANGRELDGRTWDEMPADLAGAGGES